MQYHYLATRPADANVAGPYSYANAGDGSDYSAYHETYHAGLREFMQRFGYYDVFLIDFDSGDIVYSVAKEVDFGTNLLTGPYRSTGLAEVVWKVQREPIRGRATIVDFSPYLPSYNAPASFIAAPIYNGPHVIGIIALQVPVDRIQDIMTGERNWSNEGMGETGETYIIGQDMLMRSDSRFLIENKSDYFDMVRKTGLSEDIMSLIDKMETSILLQPVQTEGAMRALKGDTGYLVSNDYRDVTVLSTYSKLDIDGLDWGIVSEIDESEAFEPIGKLLQRIMISTAIFIPIVAYLSFWLSQSFLRPVRHLTETAREMKRKYEDGDIEAADAMSFKSDNASEYQDLSHALNHILEKTRDDMKDTRQRQLEYTNLVTSALPLAVAERFRSGDKHIFDESKMATALFVQISNFQSLMRDKDFATMKAYQFELDSAATKLGHKYGLDVFHQIGMEFIAVSGLTTQYMNHSERVFRFLKEIFAAIEKFNAANDCHLELDIGLDVGPMVGSLETDGVLDYDILGEVIYTCREVGYLGESEGICVTERAIKYLKDKSITGNFKKAKETIVLDDKPTPVWWISGDDVMKMKVE
ncbi:adenylate/guanylate cyclase domain-containing protein [Litorimonas sp. RW-G-Af-16]|uniref:adenylate/guanylate cyclase domain-containing protein n=1 Tax=Litorimonas sp. RW-G-Af-16 TaxID=3241168 RepID=UPI003AAF115E